MVQTSVRFGPHRKHPAIRVQARVRPLTLKLDGAGGEDMWDRAGCSPQHAHQPALSKDITTPFHQLSGGRVSLVHLEAPGEVRADEFGALISTSMPTGCQAECDNLSQG